jgi:hypothetical protein
MAKPEFAARRGEPKTTYGYTDVDGNQKTFKSDDHGVVVPRNALEEQVLVSQGATHTEAKPQSTTTRSRSRATAKPAEAPAPTQPVTPAVTTTGETDGSR